MILIGPFDLSASIGTPSQFGNQEHKDLAEKAIDGTKSAKVLGHDPIWKTNNDRLV